MINVNQAVGIAKHNAATLLDASQSNLEEIERNVYQGRDTWSITLSVARDLNGLSPVARLGIDPLVYRRFIIDSETGELIAMKMREVATQ